MLYTKAQLIDRLNRIPSEGPLRKESVIHWLLAYIDDLEVAQTVHAMVDIYREGNETR